MDMCRSESNEKGNTPLPGSASSVSGVGDRAINGGGGADELSTKRPPHLVHDEGMVKENATGVNDSMPEHSEELPPLGEMSRKFAADVLPECQLLSSLTQR